MPAGRRRPPAGRGDRRARQPAWSVTCWPRGRPALPGAGDRAPGPAAARLGGRGRRGDRGRASGRSPRRCRRPRPDAAGPGWSPSAPPTRSWRRSERARGVHVPVQRRAPGRPPRASCQPLGPARAGAAGGRRSASSRSTTRCWRARGPAGRRRRGCRPARSRSSTRRRRWRCGWPVDAGGARPRWSPASPPRLRRHAGQHRAHPVVPARCPARPAGAGRAFDGPFAARSDDVFADLFLDAPGGPACGWCCCATAAPGPGSDERAPSRSDAMADACAPRRGAGCAVTWSPPRAGHALERLASLVAFPDFASVYLAVHRARPRP